MSVNTLEKNTEIIIANLFSQIEKIIVSNKEKMAYQINNTLVTTYFNIGKIIVENEQNFPMVMELLRAGMH